MVEIETDKVTQELYAPADGVIAAIGMPEGETAAVGAVIGSFEEGAAGSAPAAAAPAAAPAASGSDAGSNGSGDGGAVMPAAQRLLDEHGLKAGDVKATGPGGRLLKEDVQAFVASGGKPASNGAAAASAPAPAAPSAGPRDEEAVPMTALRKRIAANLVEAQQTAALLTTFNELDMTAVMATRSKYKDSFETVSYTHLTLPTILLV